MTYVYIVRREEEVDVFTDLALAEEWANIQHTQVETEGVIDRDTLDAMRNDEFTEED